jgi:hypothetical protein
MTKKATPKKTVKIVKKGLVTPSKNLSKNIKAVTKAVTKTAKEISAPKKKLKQLSKKKSYTLRQLPVRYRGEKVTDFLLNLEKHPELDKLKRPGESWEFSFFGNHSRKIYETLELAAQDLYVFATSSQSAPNRKGNHKTDEELLDNIRLIKFGGKGIDLSHELDDDDFESQVEQHTKQVKQKIRKHEERKSKVSSKALAEVEKKIGKKARSTTDLLEGLLDINKSLTKRLAALEKQLKAANKAASPKKAQVKKQNVRKSTVQKGTKQKKSSVSKVATKPATKKASGASGQTRKPTTKKTTAKKGTGKRK